MGIRRLGLVVLMMAWCGAGMAQQQAASPNAPQVPAAPAVPAQAAPAGPTSAPPLAPGAAAPAGPALESPLSAKPDEGIHLDVVVTPRDGAPVAGLTQQDFTVTDNKAQQAITSFRAVSGRDAQVEVILVIDDVNTTYTSIAYERGELDKFFKANGGKLAYPTQLVVFTDTQTQIQQGFTQDGNAQSAALDHYTVGLRDLTRSAGFYGATDRLQLSIKTLQQLAVYSARLPGRKLILWISPGWPLLNGPNVEISGRAQQSIFSTIVGLSTALREARATLYSIDPLGTQDAGGGRLFYYQNFLKGVRKPSETGYGNLGLQVIATQTGGQVLNASNDVAALLQRAIADAGSYYELTFKPTPDEPNVYHQIDVRVAKPGLIARTRTGYYSGR
jgi:VWFA-related protein